MNILPPKSTNDLVQWYRCQEYVHTKTYCRKSVNCVKCGLGHLATNCTKDNNSEPRSVNYLQNHPASYKGCIVYKQLIKKKVHQKRSNKIHSATYNYNKEYPYLNNNTFESNMNINQKNSFEKLEHLIQNHIELTNKLLNMMTGFPTTQMK